MTDAPPPARPTESSLDLAVVGPSRSARRGATRWARALRGHLSAAGHAVHRVPDPSAPHLDAVLVILDRAVGAPAQLARARSTSADRSVLICPPTLGLGAPGLGTEVREALVRPLLRHCDITLVHRPEDARRAEALGARRVVVAHLPEFDREPTGGGRAGRGATPGPGQDRARLLLLDAGPASLPLVVDAVRRAPATQLTIASPVAPAGTENWPSPDAPSGGSDRIEVRTGALPEDALSALLERHDALIVPAPGTGTALDAVHQITLAQAHGLPVIAVDSPVTRARLRDGVDSLLVPAADGQAWASAIGALGDPGLRSRLAEGAGAPDLSGPWAAYLGTLEALVAPTDHAAEDLHDPAGDPDDELLPEPTPPRPRTPVGTSVRSSLRRAEATLAGALPGLPLRRTRHLGRSDLPDWVRPTDALHDRDAADDALRVSRQLHLPLAFDRVEAWAALGALAAIIRIRDGGRRTTVVVDEGRPRSVLSRWARAVGFEPVRLSFTGPEAPVGMLDIDAGSLDVVVRIHPDGCDGTDIDLVLDQAAWALRPGGLLVVTLPVGPPSSPGAIGTAEVRAVIARAADAGLALVGDLDRSATAAMRDAGARARVGHAAYGLVRLTFRRR